MFKDNNANNVILVCVLLSLNIFHTFSSFSIICFGQKKISCDSGVRGVFILSNIYGGVFCENVSTVIIS